MAAINPNSRLKKQLAAATCALLGTVRAGQAGTFEGWEIDTAVLYYQEADDRVSAVEPTVKIKKDFGEGRVGDLKLTLDALTGATPNGATASDVPQTFTRPSGNDTYVVEPGDIPLDDTFRDTRIQVNGSWQQPLGRRNLLTMGANVSKEYDFLSYGGSLLFARDFFQKNTTLSFGVSTEFDTIDPEGGVPIPFGVMAPAGTAQPKTTGTESKDVLDFLLGVTQVLNRRTLTQVNYSYSKSDGYLADPFKLLSRINPATGSTVDYVYENRPDTRTKHSLYWLMKYHLTRDIITGAYRYYTDDWGIKSHTLDMNYHWKYTGNKYLEPRIRLYQQSEADFFKVNLLSGDPLPAEASADYRLAEFRGITGGLKWGWRLKNEHEFIIRAEYYTQVGDSSPDTAIGIQRSLDLYPDLKATIFQVQYTF